MKNHITIARVTTFSPKVAVTVKRLAAEIGHNYKPLTDKDIEEMIASSMVHLFIAHDEIKQEYVGMVTLSVYRIPYVKKAYIDDLIVDVRYQGQGIGTELMETALAYAREKGAAYVDFTARPRRVKSNTLYEKLGFKKRETNVYRFVIDYGEV